MLCRCGHRWAGQGFGAVCSTDYPASPRPTPLPLDPLHIPIAATRLASRARLLLSDPWGNLTCWCVAGIYRRMPIRAGSLVQKPVGALKLQHVYGMLNTTGPLAWRLFATALGGRVGPRVRCNARSSIVAPHCLVWARTTIGAVGRQCRLGF